jgi:REP element-mobilizing transposase RayT
MEIPKRKHLPHSVPMWVDPEKSTYFITVHCQDRTTNQLATDTMASAIFETVVNRQTRRLWWPHLFLIMPDHVHALLSFPRSGKTMKQVIETWKEWTAKQLGIGWQRDFFEHRLRDEESLREKADYILQNPVRDGLVPRAEDWPYVYFAENLSDPG